MIIKVTKLDIKRGTQGDDSECPVARALRRQVNPRRKFRVDGGRIVLEDNDYRVLDKIKTPKKVANFIRKFDEDRSIVRPFTFSIRQLRA